MPPIKQVGKGGLTFPHFWSNPPTISPDFLLFSLANPSNFSHCKCFSIRITYTTAPTTAMYIWQWYNCHMSNLINHLGFASWFIRLHSCVHQIYHWGNSLTITYTPSHIPHLGSVYHSNWVGFNYHNESTAGADASVEALKLYTTWS